MSNLEHESPALRRIHRKAMAAKHECFFVGFLDGLLANDRLDETEVEPLLAECAAICRLVGDDDAAEIVAEASAGHANTKQELLELLQQIAQTRSRRIDGSCSRSSANRLLGFCAGVNCDNIITRREARVLLGELSAGHDLRDDPRISALCHVLRDALEDDRIEPSESEEIGKLITHLVGDSYADTGVASSEAVPVIQDLDEISETSLEGQRVVLTGGFAFGTRRSVTERLEDLGAIVQRSPTKQTDIIVIGSAGSPCWTHKTHGGKLADALKMRSSGPVPRIYVEAQLRRLMN